MLAHLPVCALVSEDWESGLGARLAWREQPGIKITLGLGHTHEHSSNSKLKAEKKRGMDNLHARGALLYACDPHAARAIRFQRVGPGAVGTMRKV